MLLQALTLILVTIAKLHMTEGSLPCGVKSSESGIPWQAGVIYKNTRLVCGGVLVSKNFVLTSAHCVKTFIGDGFLDITVVVGESNLQHPFNSVNYDLVGAFTHPLFQSHGHIFDVGLLELSSSVELGDQQNIICLPDNTENNLFDDEEATVRGFGDAAALQPKADPYVLNELTVSTMTNEACIQAFRDADFADTIYRQMICAEGENNNGRISTCRSDSGAPLTISEDSNGQEVSTLIGVASFSIGCEGVNAPGVYSRVTDILDFINKFIH